MSRNVREGLLARWSRVKRESTAYKGDPSVVPLNGGEHVRAGDGSSERQDALEPRSAGEQRDSHRRESNQQDDNAPLQLPPLEELGPDSDFQAFMDPRVDDETRRAALKTLFRDPAFNVTDGLDVYARDYSKLEKLTPAMVAALRYAQRNLFAEPEASEQNTMAERADPRANAAGESPQSGETGTVPAATPAAGRSSPGGIAENTNDGDEQAGSRAGMANHDRASRDLSADQSPAEESGEAGSMDSGNRCG